MNLHTLVRWNAVLTGWIALVVSVCGAAAPPQTKEDGFVPLFDGKTLDGWEGNLDYWTARDGMIVGDSPGIKHNEFLCTKQEFEDFELRVTFRILGDETKNSGVQFRSKRVPNNKEVSGYQADVGQHYWGCLYDESRRNKVLVQAPAEELAKVVKKDDWNTYVIRCEGPRITLTLNGLKTVDYTEKDDAIPRKGIIGLQIHGGNALQAQFKAIRIKRLNQ
ncbi:MAG: DUF1080 domain-containing protein [Planctomycetes bacterium]|nr:DUF1080 domain-containing protein [Planctomycetota bacterium]